MSHQIEFNFELIKSNTPLIDVRAPIEFNQGHLPNAINLPLLNDEERALVGTHYKKYGKEEAIALGHQLVSGENKQQKLLAWKNFILQNPNAIIYCFRGGLRSQTVQKWLKEELRIDIPIIKTGYKNARNLLTLKMNDISTQLNFVVISGKTGSAKTKFLQQISSQCPALDLEKLANHRGSAFGGLFFTQPTQTQFEINLAHQLILLEHSRPYVFIEDESRMIGKNVLPDVLFNKMRMSPVVWFETSLENRVTHIKEEYVDYPRTVGFTDEQLTNLFLDAIKNISSKLGGLRSKEISDDIIAKNHEAWIRKLLIYYYDPLYEKSIERRRPHFLFKGSCEEFYQSFSLNFMANTISI